MNASSHHQRTRFSGRRRLALAAACLTACVGLASAASAQNFTLTDEQFDSWITNGNSTIKERVKAQLAIELRTIEQSCELTPLQRAKLELAGQGDAARFEAKVAEVRSRLVGKTYDQNEINTVWQEIQPLQQESQAGLLGEDSLFVKVTRRTLDDEQAASYEALQSERRAAIYEAKVRLYIAMLERSAPMRDKQREALLNLFMQRTRPPKRFGENEIYYVMYQASTLDRKEITKFFDNAQMKVITPAFRQGSNYKNFLEQQGFIFDEEPPRPKPKPKVKTLRAREKPKGDREKAGDKDKGVGKPAKQNPKVVAHARFLVRGARIRAEAAQQVRQLEKNK